MASSSESAGHFFIRIVDEDAIEAAANEAHRLGFRSIDWEQVREGTELTAAAWMVYGQRPPPGACPFCDGVVPDEDEGDDADDDAE